MTPRLVLSMGVVATLDATMSGVAGGGVGASWVVDRTFAHLALTKAGKARLFTVRTCKED